jgi:polyferredoxin
LDAPGADKERSPAFVAASAGERRVRARRLKIARRSVQGLFLALFVILAVKAAFPPLAAPPSNFFLRLDPLAGLVALATTRSAAVLARFWPAWILLGLTALSSRFFCGWICPLGTCFDAVGAVKPKALKYYRPGGAEARERLAAAREGRSQRRFRIKYVLLAVVLAFSLAGVDLLYFASPLVIANRGVYYLLLPQVPVLLLILALLAFAYRPRFWCEELCPMGALMSVVSMAGKRLGSRLSPLSVVKNADACVDCGACYRTCSFGVDEPLTLETNGRLRSADCTACGDCVEACPAPVALALESFGLTVARSSDRAVRKPANNLSGGSTVPAPGSESTRGLTVSRGEFIASVGLGAVLAVGYGAGLGHIGTPVLRMPGAQDEGRFLAECSRCQECARACPPRCLKPMGLEGGFQKLWTPRFVPRTAGCVFDQCGQACARVCPMGAIARQKPAQVRIGTAHIRKGTCLGWRGKICLVCQERCRFNAIRADGLRPIVIEEKCTGCGACEETCPTEPASIVVLPTGSSPDAPSGGQGGRGRARTGGAR